MEPLTHYLSQERVEQILSQMPNLRLGVVGDLGLDAYWYADMTISVLSRETPLFPRPVVREIHSPGAGANVADNLKALGVGEVIVFSVLGEDWRGAILQRVMAERGITIDHLIVSRERSTTTFIKPILMGHNSQQEDARIDFENDRPLAPALEKELIERVYRLLPELDGLLIADQLDVHGIITDGVREALNQLAGQQPHKVFVADSRQHIGLFRNIILKPNWVEAARAVQPERDPRTITHEELAAFGAQLSQRCRRPVFITLSEEGVMVCAEGSQRILPAAPVRPPLDPVGAGDTFIAALAATLAVGATPWEAGAIANLAAAVTVEKLHQTGTASPQEILERYRLAAEKRQ